MNTLKFGNGEWYGKKDTILAYNDENSNFKPLPFSFDRASSATRVNKDGLIETVGSGEPRIDYKDDSKGALKLEPTRSNLVTYSEDFSDSYWYKSGTYTITNNYGISPDGTNNSTRIQGDANTVVYRGVGSSTDARSIYVKATSGSGSIQLLSHNNNTNNVFAIDENWKRVEINSTSVLGDIFYVVDFRGASTDVFDIEIYGAQVEQGSYATSYIPTQGSAVTRVDDSCLGQIIGYDTSSSFSLFFSFGKTRKATQGSTHIFSLNTTSGKDIYLYTNSSGNDGLNIYITNGGGYVFGANQNNGWNAEQSKICITYDISTSRFAYFINGSLYGYQTNVLNLGQTDYTSIVSNNNIFETREHKFYNNALTDQEAIALTTI